MNPRRQRMLSEDTSRKAWRAFEDALRAEKLVVITESKLFILDFYGQVVERHGKAHATRQVGCPTCSAIADLAGQTDD